MDFEEFREQYELMHPGEKPLPPERVQEGSWMRLGIGAMFICSAAISGVHTIPTIYSTVEGALVDEWIRRVSSIGSFFAVEMGILLTGYGISANPWVNRGAGGLAITVAVVCNIISVAKAFNSGTPGDIAVSLILGVFAPVMALLAGKAFEGQRERLEVEIERRRAVHKAEVQTWNEQLAEAFRAEERRQERRTLRLQASAEPVRPDNTADTSVRADVRSDGAQKSGHGYDRTADAMTKATEWFNANPDEARRLSVRALEQLIGVSKTTISDARRTWLEQQQLAAVAPTNGHAPSEEQS